MVEEIEEDKETPLFGAVGICIAGVVVCVFVCVDLGVVTSLGVVAVDDGFEDEDEKEGVIGGTIGVCVVVVFVCFSAVDVRRFFSEDRLDSVLEFPRAGVVVVVVGWSVLFCFFVVGWLDSVSAASAEVVEVVCEFVRFFFRLSVLGVSSCV